MNRNIELVGYVDCEYGSRCKKWDFCPLISSLSVGEVKIPKNIGYRGDDIMDYLAGEYRKRIPEINEDCIDPENPMNGNPVKRFVKSSCFSFINK